jgi:hypothetical protein
VPCQAVHHFDTEHGLFDGVVKHVQPHEPAEERPGKQLVH